MIVKEFLNKLNQEEKEFELRFTFGPSKKIYKKMPIYMYEIFKDFYHKTITIHFE